MKRITHKVGLIGTIAAIYTIATIGLGSLSYSWIQVRVSESLTPLPFLWGAPAVIGITLGVILGNLLSPIGLLDLIFGPLLSMIAALLSWKLNHNNKILACLYPILINAFGVSSYVSYFYDVPYFLSVISIGIGQFISCFVIGYPLLIALEKINFDDIF